MAGGHLRQAEPWYNGFSTVLICEGLLGEHVFHYLMPPQQQPKVDIADLQIHLSSQ